MSDRHRIGTAGWSIPRAVADRFPATGSALERYAALFDAVEINSSFYRPHKRTTYERWAASVPARFRFALKLPRTITHDRRLVACEDLVAHFAEETAGLGDRRGPILVQLPPSFAFAAEVAMPFFTALHAAMAGPIVCEPRHLSWFDDQAGALLREARVARVAADPARCPEAACPGGWEGLAYWRLHGSPRIYRSEYSAEQVEAHAAGLEASDAESWTIYDNTASGAAMANALALRDMIRRG